MKRACSQSGVLSTKWVAIFVDIKARLKFPIWIDVSCMDSDI